MYNIILLWAQWESDPADEVNLKASKCTHLTMCAMLRPAPQANEVQAIFFHSEPLQIPV